MTAAARRAGELARALRRSRALAANDRLDREAYRALTRQRLLALIRHAASASPFYRERLAGQRIDESFDIATVPILDKAELLAGFDRIVCDPRLTLARLEEHLGELEHRDGEDVLLDGRYRVMASGGTTGRRGIFVYGRADWSLVLGGLLRWTGDYMHLPPRLPRRRIAAVVADSPLHMTARMGRSIDVGAHRLLRLDARAPLERIVAALNGFQPDALTAFASVAALLADEQTAGRLRVAPGTVATTSEVCTGDMRERIEAAWGAVPYNGYAATETGMLATDCDRHRGLHVLEDLVHLEAVDDANRPVPAGTPAAKLLVTNLVNRTQPLIRFELSDLVTVSPEPCPCGRPSVMIAGVDGRSDDILMLPGREGGTVAVHPLTLRSPLAAVAGLRQYRIVHDRGAIAIEVVAEPGHDVAADVRVAVAGALDRRGVVAPSISVDRVERIERHPGSGKAKLVESRLA